MLQKGTKVRIKDNAFEGTGDPQDFEARGRVGVISDITADVISVDACGYDYPVLADEIEELPEDTLLFDDFLAVQVTDRYKAALIELLQAEVEMMRQNDEESAFAWYYGRVTIGNLANSNYLKFEFGSESDIPNDGLGQFGILFE